MMKFLCLAYYDTEVTASHSKEEVAAVVKHCKPHDRALHETGRVVFQAALGTPDETRVIRPPRSKKQRFTDGPFTEAKEMVGGFFVIEAADMDEAVRIASLHPAGNIGETLGWGIEIWPIRRLDRFDGQPPA
jgi:hypothetical protein